MHNVTSIQYMLHGYMLIYDIVLLFTVMVLLIALFAMESWTDFAFGMSHDFNIITEEFYMHVYIPYIVS